VSASLFQPIKALFAPNDEQLMWRVQMEDNHEAFAELVSRWQEPIRRLCTRLTSDEHRAQDLTQEVFTKLFLHRKSFQQRGRLSTYLWRIALNHCSNERRRAQYRHETRLEPTEDNPSDGPDRFPATTPAPDEETAANEAADVVRHALAALPEDYRNLLILRHYENLKFREIAEILDLPEGTVKTRMTEALNTMGRLLRRPLDLRVCPPPNRRARLNGSTNL
jgi:RNA polymerase sigma-70 factor, ECF subfamily